MYVYTYTYTHIYIYYVLFSWSAGPRAPELWAREPRAARVDFNLSRGHQQGRYVAPFGGKAQRHRRFDGCGMACAVASAHLRKAVVIRTA